ncbi:MAG TPA: LysM peptidoglycan-binding domain-containing protein, partial [Anaerolineae bacterium]|nr:LysM peptidoglycan-binding domain-containing protein [Anaerolineae bacterium]
MMTFFRRVTLAVCLTWGLLFAVSCGGQAQLTGGIPLPSLDDEAASNHPVGSDQAGDEGAGSLNPQRPVAPEPIATAVPAMPIPTPAMEPYAYHTVAVGESLTYIAELYETEIETLVRLNGLSGPDAFIQIDQVLRIPLATDDPGPSDFILPDSEVIYSPAYVDFDTAKFAKKKGGYLVDYVEYVDGYARTGPEIIELIAERFGVGPRLLLALLEHYGGWVTNPTLSEEKISMPLGPRNIYANSLYHGLAFTANRINAGYYGYKRDGFWVFELADYSRAVTPQGLNAGTVGIQNLLAVHSDGDTWLEELGPDGLMATYRKLFGDPAKYALKQPVVPFDLTQPPLSLPWGQGKGFYFTSGPHSGYIDGSAWA